jgi:hypothetical protein
MARKGKESNHQSVIFLGATIQDPTAFNLEHPSQRRHHPLKRFPRTSTIGLPHRMSRHTRMAGNLLERSQQNIKFPVAVIQDPTTFHPEHPLRH